MATISERYLQAGGCCMIVKKSLDVLAQQYPSMLMDGLRVELISRGTFQNPYFRTDGIQSTMTLPGNRDQWKHHLWQIRKTDGIYCLVAKEYGVLLRQMTFAFNKILAVGHEWSHLLQVQGEAGMSRHDLSTNDLSERSIIEKNAEKWAWSFALQHWSEMISLSELPKGISISGMGFDPCFLFYVFWFTI